MAEAIAAAMAHAGRLRSWGEPMIASWLRAPFIALLLVAAVGCTSSSHVRSDRSRVRNAPPGPADLCRQIGAELFHRLIPDGEPTAEANDFGLSNEESCAVTSLTHGVATIRGRLYVELHRHGTDASGRTSDEICRQDFEGHKQQYLWPDPTASDIPVRLGDIAAAQVRPVGDAFEADLLLCRSADFLYVSYQASGIDRAAAGTGAEDVARRLLAPRAGRAADVLRRSHLGHLVLPAGRWPVRGQRARR
jgi:hypothetical protein